MPPGLCTAGAKESHSHDARDRHDRISRSGRGASRSNPSMIVFGGFWRQFHPSCCTRSASPCGLEFVKLTALHPQGWHALRGCCHLLPSVASGAVAICCHIVMPLFLRLKQFAQNPGCCIACFCRHRSFRPRG